MKKFKNLVRSKYAKEKSKCEVAMLKQRLAHNHLPEGFGVLEIPLPISLDTINNENTRQRLKDRSEKILQRAKSEMMIVYIVAEETKMNEDSMSFNTDFAQMLEDQRSGPSDNKLTETMLNIMTKRFHNIDERFTYLQQLKLRFFAPAPTIKN